MNSPAPVKRRHGLLLVLAGLTLAVSALPVPPQLARAFRTVEPKDKP
jgi:hypothetical protein